MKIDFTICIVLLASTLTAAEIDITQRQARQQDTNQSQPIQKFDPTLCQLSSITQEIQAYAKPQLYTLPSFNQLHPKRIHRTRGLISICHPQKNSFVGKLIDPTVIIARVVLYLDNVRDRIELIFNMIDHKNGTQWFGNNTHGLARRTTLFSDNQQQALFNYTVDKHITTVQFTLTDSGSNLFSDNSLVSTTYQILITKAQGFRLTLVFLYLMVILEGIAFFKLFRVKRPRYIVYMFLRYELPALTMTSLLVKMLVVTYHMVYTLVLLYSSMSALVIFQIVLAIFLHALFCFSSCCMFFNCSKYSTLKKMATFVIPLIIVEVVLYYSRVYMLASTIILVILPQINKLNASKNHNAKNWYWSHYKVYTLMSIYFGVLEFRNQTDFILCTGLTLLYLFQRILIKQSNLIGLSIRMSEYQCPVCLNDIEENSLYITSCNHTYHKECIIMSSLTVNNLCPMCKTYISIPLDQD